MAGLFAASVAIQVLIPAGAADEYDLTKWAYVNYFGASTGYYKVARNRQWPIRGGSWSSTRTGSGARIRCTSAPIRRA